MGNKGEEPLGGCKLSITVIRRPVPNQPKLFRMRCGVPFVLFLSRPFERQIHGTVNLTTFCYLLRVLWCHRVRFSCYFCQKRGTVNLCKIEGLTSHLVHIFGGDRSNPTFTHRISHINSRWIHRFTTLRNSYEFVRNSHEFRTNRPPFCLVTAICCTHSIFNNLFCKSLDTR